MPSSAEQTFNIYELTERILLQLNDLLEIIRAQRVCRRWRDIIQRSPALQEACWYPPDNANTHPPPTRGERAWRLNPAFNVIGGTVYPEQGQIGVREGELQEEGEFSLEERIYDKPGSWTTMLATWPPCTRMLVFCDTGDSYDQTLVYLIDSVKSGLIMGDVMAVLAECQNRQQCGLDVWMGFTYPICRLARWEPVDCLDYVFEVLNKLPDDVSIKVSVETPYAESLYPAFSLRRLGRCKDFLHELIPHKMIVDGTREYKWEDRKKLAHPVLEEGYKANLVVVKEHSGGYLSNCSHIFRLLSEQK